MNSLTLRVAAAPSHVGPMAMATLLLAALAACAACGPADDNPPPAPSYPVPTVAQYDGEYRVGGTIATGTYQAVVPGQQAGACYWEVLLPDHVTRRASQRADGGTTVVVHLKDGDGYFSIDDCGSWTRIAP